MPSQLRETFKEGAFHVYNNRITLKDLEECTRFTDLFTDDRKSTTDGKPSIALNILYAICENGEVAFWLKGETVRDVLDLGCGIGHFSFLLHEHFPNVRVTGVDKSTLEATAIAGLKHYSLLRVIFSNSEIVEYVEHTTWRPDLVLMLNVFDHLLRQNEEDAWAVLDELSRRTRYLALMMGPHDGIVLPNDLLNYCNFRYVHTLLEDTGYAGRTLYLLER